MRMFIMFMSGAASSLFGYCMGAALGGRRMAREIIRLTRENTDLATALNDCMGRYDKLQRDKDDDIRNLKAALKVAREMLAPQITVVQYPKNGEVLK